MKRHCLLMLVLFSLSGCSFKSEAENKAIWLCLYGHWVTPILTQFPKEHPPELYLSAHDIAFMKEGDQQSDFVELVILDDPQLDKIMTGFRQAVAERSECKVLAVHVEPSKTRMTIEVQRHGPSNWLSIYSERLDELKALRSASEVASKTKTWIDAGQTWMVTHTVKMLFIKERGHWVLSLGLKEAREAWLKKKAAQASLRDELSHKERIKAELERELKKHLDDASVFNQLEIQLLSITKMTQEESKERRWKNGYWFKIARNGRKYEELSHAVFAVGFKLPDGTSIWEHDVWVLELGGGASDRSTLEADLGDWVIPSDAKPYVHLQRVVRGKDAYDINTIKQAQQEAKSYQEKLSVVDAEIAKLRAQLP